MPAQSNVQLRTHFRRSTSAASGNTIHQQACPCSSAHAQSKLTRHGRVPDSGRRMSMQLRTGRTLDRHDPPASRAQTSAGVQAKSSASSHLPSSLQQLRETKFSLSLGTGAQAGIVPGQGKALSSSWHSLLRLRRWASCRAALLRSWPGRWQISPRWSVAPDQTMPMDACPGGAGPAPASLKLNALQVPARAEQQLPWSASPSAA